MAPIVSARNGCTFSQVIKTMITANPASAAMISRVSETASGTICSTGGTSMGTVIVPPDRGERGGGAPSG